MSNLNYRNKVDAFVDRQKELDQMFSLDDYKENEENNCHTENYLALARKFGSQDEILTTLEIISKKSLRGCLTVEESELLYRCINPYYQLLIKKEKENVNSK